MEWEMRNDDGHEVNMPYSAGEDKDALKPLSLDGSSDSL